MSQDEAKKKTYEKVSSWRGAWGEKVDFSLVFPMKNAMCPRVKIASKGVGGNGSVARFGPVGEGGTYLVPKG